MVLKFPSFTLSKVGMSNVSTVPSRSNLLHEDDADPFIMTHAIHWLSCIETYERQRRSQIGSWELVYHDHESCMYSLGTTVVLACRGTDEAKDIYDDIEISFGRAFPRAIEAADFLYAFMILNPNISVQLTGHSLGGAIAREVGRVLNLPIVSFNAAAPPTHPVTVPEHSVNYHIVFDMISAWQSPNTIRIDKGHRPLSVAYNPIVGYLPYYWAKNFKDQMLGSHKLTNFAKHIEGVRATPCDENKLFSTWWAQVPLSVRLYMFGGGITILPRIK